MHFVEAVLLAVLNSLVRFRALLHPYVLDACRVGFAYHFLRLGGRHDDHHAVHGHRQYAEAGVAPIALNSFDVAIDRVHLVAFFLQRLVSRVAELVRIARHAHHCEFVRTDEILDKGKSCYDKPTP